MPAPPRANPFGAAPAAADHPQPSASALGLRRRSAPLRVDPTAGAPVRTDESDDEREDDALERMSTRGLFLLAASVAAFAAFSLFVLTEWTHQDGPALWVPVAPAVQREAHATALWVLMLAVPLTSTAAWFPVSISRPTSGQLRIRSPVPLSPTAASSSLVSTIARRYRRNGTFAVYQSVGWGLYALFLALLLACAASDGALPLCAAGARSNLAVLAFMAEVLMISSVLTLERRRDRTRQRKDRFVVQLNNFNNMLLLVGAVTLAVSSEYTRHHHEAEQGTGAYSLSTGVGSLLLFVTALLNTYGLGGVLSTKDGWRFYQPFTGGARFVLFQVISWTCFGAGLLLQGLYLVSLVVVELELFVGAMLAAGALFLTSEVVMMMSLLVFKKSEPSVETATKAPVATGARSAFQQRLRDFADECLGVLVVGGLANIQFIPNALFFVYYAATTNLGPLEVALYGAVTTVVEFFMVISRSIASHLYNKDSNYGQRTEISKYHVKYVLPTVLTAAVPAVATYRHYIYDMDALYAVAFLTAALYVYEFTYREQPQQSGARMRPDWVTGQSALMNVVKKYFSGRILSRAELDPRAAYVMAFHPHGIMAISVMWLQFNDAWRKRFPNVYAHILTASVLHQIPLARDVLQFFGGREVTRQAFVSTLQEKESVLVVPGGQAEMLEQQSARKEVRVYTHHKGFIRVAIEQGAPLVPVLSFKEGELMDNVRAPALQRWFIKKLGLPFPYFPYGRGLLPVPRKTDVVVAVGSPLPVKQIASPSAKDVDRVHREYFQRLQELFLEYKDEAGCADYKLVLI